MSPSKVQRDPKLHAVFSIDPGGTSGIAAGYVLVKPTLKETLETLDRKKATEITGDYLSQASQIAAAMWSFQFTANVEAALPMDQIHFVCEDFVLRRRQQGGATGNLTSVWVAAAAMGMYNALLSTPDVKTMMKTPEGSSSILPVEWVQASHAKGLATNQRLKMWGLWEVGSEHKRDAWRHFAYAVNGIVE